MSAPAPSPRISSTSPTASNKEAGYSHPAIPPHDERHIVHTASAKSQLAVWHANRGNKSFLQATVPSWKKPATEVGPETRNPIKLIRMVSPVSSLMFFS